MKCKTATASAKANGNGGQRLVDRANLMAIAHGWKPAPRWMDGEAVGEDGYLVEMPVGEKRQEALRHARERERWAREAEEAGDHSRAAFERRQAQHERQLADRLQRQAVPRARERRETRSKARGAAQRSSARSGDSGDDGSSDSAEPPQAGRLCRRCNRPFTDPDCRVKYCHDCRGKKGYRVDAQRARDRENPDRVAARSFERRTADGPANPCKCGTEGVDLDRVLVAIVCRACGRPRAEASVAVNGATTKAAEFVLFAALMESNGVSVRPRWKADGWKTRPKRELSAKLRKTRSPETVAATTRRRATA